MDALQCAALYIVDESLLLAGRQQQTAQVNPVAFTHCRRGLAQPSALHGTLQHGTHVDTQGNVVILDTLAQRRGVDDVFVVVIRRHVVAASLAQRLQDLLTLNNLSNGKRRQPVEVDDALTARRGTLVALLPLLDVTVQTYCGDITSRDDIHRLAICQQVGKGQAAHVGMVHQLAETDAEGTDLGRHQDVGSRGGLRTALQCTVVQGSHFVGVVREVGVRTGIVERELTANQQRALMV